MASADYGDFGRAEPVAVIDTIGVDPGFSHAGIGRALLSQLFMNLDALRVERVESVVAKEHFELLGFLYRAGFGPSTWRSSRLSPESGLSPRRRARAARRSLRPAYPRSRAGANLLLLHVRDQSFGELEPGRPQPLPVSP